MQDSGESGPVSKSCKYFSSLWQEWYPTVSIYNALTTKHISMTGFYSCYHSFWLLMLDNNAILRSIYFDMLLITILIAFTRWLSKGNFILKKNWKTQFWTCYSLTNYLSHTQCCVCIITNTKHWLGQISSIILPGWDHNLCWNICAFACFWNIFRSVIIGLTPPPQKSQQNKQTKTQPPSPFSSISYIYGKRLILFESIYLPHYCIICDLPLNILLSCTDHSSRILVKMFKNTSG